MTALPLLAASVALVVGCGPSGVEQASAESRAAAPVLGRTQQALVSTSVIEVNGDTTIRSGLPNLNDGTGSQLSVQIASRHRSILYFDAAALRAAATGSQILSARVELQLTSNLDNWGPLGRLIGIHKMLRTSSESTATWACANDVNTGSNNVNCTGDDVWDMNATGAAAPFVEAPTSRALITNGQTGVVSFDVTADVLAAIAGTDPGLSWLIKKVDETLTGSITFASRELGPAPRLLLELESGPSCTPSGTTDATCNGVDDDCDGSIDEEYTPVATSCGTGVCAAAGVTSCVEGELADSCEALLPTGSVDATCNGIDEDCDGSADEDFVPEATSCGVGACAATGATSCVDGAVTDGCTAGTPAADDASCNAVDDDCDGSVDEEYAPVATSCGVGACAAAGVTSCALGVVSDSCAAGTPAADDASCNAVDDDCDGSVDEEYAPVATSCGVGACAATGTTSCTAGSISDSCAAGAPAADDASCNAVDDDCDGSVDEEYAPVATSCGVGACAATGATSCTAGSISDSCAAGTPAADDASCNAVDDDCDGSVDEEYAPVATSCGVGACAATGATSCTAGSISDSCAAGAPAADDASCNAVDDDCDGSVDEEYAPVATSCGVGACAATGVTSCQSGAIVDGCSPGTPSGADTVCDGVDEDCDGNVDEEFSPLCVGTSVRTCVAGAFQDQNCSDGDACNGAETCSLAACEPGTPPVIDDGDPCTFDSCVAATGPVHDLAPAGTECGYYRECTAVGECASLLPPDPGEVAPLLASGSVSFLERVRFMYEGSSPIQTNVAPGVFQNRSVALLRGRLLDGAGQPLPGTIVRVHGHPEFGETLTRYDGEFDIVVGGGRSLTLDFSHEGYFSAQRTVSAPWQNYSFVDDVVLITPDSMSSEIEFPTTAPELHSALPADDMRGVRTATLFVPSGTDAEVVMPGGSTVLLPSLTLRASEFSVGTLGDYAVPAELSTNSAFTYAIELSADEADALGAERVELSQPASFYVENFLALPVGSSVPVAYYDRGAARWVGTGNGRVIAILAVNAGQAELDIDGTGTAATPAALAALGIGGEELSTLGGLYEPGTSIWRAPVQHLAAYDLSFPFVTDVGAGGATPAAPSTVTALDTEVLTTAVPVAGTSYSLRYRSDRVLGYHVGQRLTVPATGTTVSSGLLGSWVDVQIAGQLHSYSFDATPGQALSFVWNGYDAEGRHAFGMQHADIRVGLVYARDRSAAATFSSAYGHYGASLTSLGSDADVDVRWTRYERDLRSIDQRELTIGAWSLDKHHRFDPVGRVLYRGDGTSAALTPSAAIIERFAGVPQAASVGFHNGDGGSALLASMDSPRALAVGPDGAVYIGTRRGVRRVDPNTNVITTVAGGKPQSTCSNTLDEGPAVDMCIFARKLDFGRDGALYISDNPTASGTYDRIRRLDLATGMISHVAGRSPGSGCANRNDGGPAEDAAICSLISHATAPDGSIYVLDRGASGPHLLRKISPNGVIQTIATGNWSTSDDGADIAVGPDGSLYITQDRVVQRVLPTGEFRHFAGDPANNGSSGEGGLATSARFGTSGPSGIMVGPDGRVYVADNGNSQLRVVDHQGIIRRIAGTSAGTPAGDGGSPMSAVLGVGVLRTAIAPDGTIYLTSRIDHTVRRIRPSVLGNFAGQMLVPSADNTETYRFDADGRHLDTTQRPSNALLYSFGYDGAGRLTSVTTGSGVTLIDRDGAGRPTRIVSPSGVETLLDTDANGYLSTIIDPSLGETNLAYDNGGLLIERMDPSGTVQTYSYDVDGRWLGN